MMGLHLAPGWPAAGRRVICLVDSMSIPGSVATGTVMRPAVLERYAREAGFAGIEILSIDGFAAFRFYRLLV